MNEEEKQPQTKQVIFEVITTVVVLALVIVGALFLLRTEMTAPVDSFCKALSTGNGSYIRQSLSDEAWAYCTEVYEKDNPDSFNSHISMLAAGLHDVLAEQYGEHLKISFKVTEKEKIKDDEFATFASSVSDRYGINPESITEAYRLTGNTTCRGDKGSDTVEGDTYTVYRMHDEWYLLSEPIS